MDVDGNALLLSAPSLPPFCSLTDNGGGTGTLSCNSAGVNSGLYALTVVVTDNGVPFLNDSEMFNLSLNTDNRAPVLQTIGDLVVDEGQTLTVSLSANDPDGDDLRYGDSGLPSYCSITDNRDGTGELSCSPGLDNAGLSVVTVTVTDDGAPNFADSEVFTIEVVNVNQAPVLSAIGNKSVDEGSTLSVQIDASDPDQELVNFSAIDLPRFCDLVDGQNNSATLSCSPKSGDANSYAISIVATDNGTPQLVDSEQFTIRVNGNGAAPGAVTNSRGGGSMDRATLIGLVMLLMLRLFQLRSAIAGSFASQPSQSNRSASPASPRVLPLTPGWNRTGHGSHNPCDFRNRQ